MADIIARLTREFNLKPFQVENTVKLIDDGNTIPFIARYRKEMTGVLNDQVLRELNERLNYLRTLEERRADVSRLIEEQGKLTSQITEALQKAETLQEIEDIYRPFRPKRRTRAMIAKEKGLEQLAVIILKQEAAIGAAEEIAKGYINAEKEVHTIEDAINGAMDIIAEDISDNPEYRKSVRELFFRHGIIVSKAKKEEDSVYRMFIEEPYCLGSVDGRASAQSNDNIGLKGFCNSCTFYYSINCRVGLHPVKNL
jgi:uncharacterized protein